MIVETIKNFPIDSNCYVVYKKGASNCLIIDPGTENCNQLILFLKKKKLSPKYIILTHEHFDHIWGLKKLFELFDLTLICSQKCFNAIVDKKKNLSVFYDNIGFEIDLSTPWFFKPKIFFDKETEIEIFETLGHSEGSISILIDNLLFTGDVLIAESKIVTKLPGGNLNKLKVTLNNLVTLFKNRNILVFPGHGLNFKFDEIDFNKLI
jgi:hydroxyacylglutathione hydrolase